MGVTKWEKIRSKILERDKFICLNCGKPATEVHHKDGSASNKSHKFWNNKPENLMSICHRCNIMLDLKLQGASSFNKGKWEEDKERTKEIINLSKKYSQSKIARMLGITRQRVNQIFKKSVVEK